MKALHNSPAVSIPFMARIRHSAIGIVLAAAPLASPAAARDRHIQVAWGELAAAAGSRVISLVLPDGAHLMGIMVEVRDDSLIVQVQKSSDSRFPRGQPASLPRGQVRVVQIRESSGPWRAAGTAIGGAGGAIAGWALAEGVWHTSGEGRGIWREPSGIASILGIGAGGALAGYVLGRRLDRTTTFLHIAP